MPGRRDLALIGWGAELRRRGHDRRAKRVRLIVAAAATLILCATLIWPPRPRLLWNASASSPLGLYLVSSPDEVALGDMVIAWAPDAARELGAARHYLPRNVPLVKRVAGRSGDRVCAVGRTIFVNGRPEAFRRRQDGAGRLMPWWTGCELLADGALFLLTPSQPQAFDGRYFGVTRRQHLVGRARLIWPV